MSQNFTEADAISGQQLHHILAHNSFVKNDTIVELGDLGQFHSLDQLFGDRYFKIVFIRRGDGIGHWTLLTHLGDTSMEYFDPSGHPPPEEVLEWGTNVGLTTIDYSNTQLQHQDSFHCGRFVLARISSQPTSLDDFIAVLSSSKRYSPDDIVGMLFNVDNL